MTDNYARLGELSPTQRKIFAARLKAKVAAARRRRRGGTARVPGVLRAAAPLAPGPAAAGEPRLRRGFARHGERPVSSATEPPRIAPLPELRRSAAGEAGEALAHHRLEVWAAERPQACAVRFRGEVLSSVAPGARGSVRVPHIRFTGVPRS